MLKDPRVVPVLPTNSSYQKFLHSLGPNDWMITAWDDSLLVGARAVAPFPDSVEFKSFSDVVQRVGMLLRDPTSSLATGAQIEAAIEAACLTLPEDSPFYESRLHRGFHQSLYETLEEMRQWGIHTLDIEEVAAASPDPAFSKWMLSLAHVSERCEETLGQMGRFLLTRVLQRQLHRSLPPGATIDPLPRLLVLAGNKRAPAFCRWLRWVASLGCEVIVVVETLGEANSLFGHANRVAEDMGCTLETPFSSLWTQGLFVPGSDLPDHTPEVVIKTCPDLPTEAEWAIRETMRAMDAGTPPDEISLVVLDGQRHVPYLLWASQMHKLPIEARFRWPLKSNSFIRFLLDLLKVLSGADVRELVPILSSSYLQSDRELHGQFREIIFKASTSSQPWLSLLNALREKFETVPWLGQFVEWRLQNMAERRSMSDWGQEFRKFMLMEPIPDKILSHESLTQDRDVRAKNRAETLLNHHASVYDASQSPSLTLPEFVSRIDKIWGQEEWILPVQAPMGVRLVTDVSQAPLTRVAIVLGVTEGVLPSRRTEDSVLPDVYRHEINRLLPEHPDLRDSFAKAQEDREKFVRVCSLPSEKLILMSALASEDSLYTPSGYLDEVRRVAEGRCVHEDFTGQEPIPSAEACVTPRDLRLRRALDAEEKWRWNPVLQSETASSLVRADLSTPIRPREFAAVLECPFASACRHRLELKDRKQRDMWKAYANMPARARLGQQPDRDQAERAMEAGIKEAIEEIAPHIHPGQLTRVDRALRIAADRWIDREFGLREMWNLTPNNVKHHVPLGDESGTRSRIALKSGRKLEFKYHFDTLIQIPEAFVGVQYGRSNPIKSAGADDDSGSVPLLDRPSAFECVLVMMLLAGRDKNAALLFDSQATTLGLSVIADDVPSFLKAKHPEVIFKQQRFRGVRNEIIRAVMAVLESGAESLISGNMTPNPGAHCDGCSYGDLCRSAHRGGAKAEASA